MPLIVWQNDAPSRTVYVYGSGTDYAADSRLISWGDGTPDELGPAASGFGTEHTYAADGVYVIVASLDGYPTESLVVTLPSAVPLITPMDPVTDQDALPANGPATLAGVKAELGILDTRADTQLARAVASTNAQLRTWPCVEPARGAADWTAPELAGVVQGADRLAARLYQRRNSPMGYESMGDLGPVYVSRNDPDLAQLLGLGAWQPVKGQLG